MNIYRFRRLERNLKVSFSREQYEEVCATIALLKSPKVRSLTLACTGKTINAWHILTKTDGKMRAIATRAVRYIGNDGFMMCVKEARRELCMLL